MRTVSFAPQRGGYAEAQVDLLLDTVVDVMLASATTSRCAESPLKRAGAW
ncbi:DivIVA domain-containing protein [Rathayibacter sp. AY1B1]